MSSTGGIATGPDSARLRQLRTNIADTFATLFRRPAPTAFRPAWPPRSRLVLGTIGAVAVVVAAMLFLDGRLIEEARRLPPWVIRTFNEITDFGKSGWFLFPIGFLIIGIAGVATTDLPRFTRLVLAAITVRLGFVFLAIAVPGLFVAILKRIIGRARPLVGEDNFVYMPFIWRNDYASIPSGHGTTGFAAAVAIGALVSVRASLHVGLRGPDRGEPGRGHRAFPERRDRRGVFRGGRGAARAQLVRGAPAGLHRNPGGRGAHLAGAVAAAHQRRCPQAVRPIKRLARAF